MKLAYTIAAVAALAIAPLAAVADGHTSGGITDQSYKGGKYSGGGASSSTVAVINDCPREFREMYRGSLYCRQPEYQVIAPRNAQCPDYASFMFRGDLYCPSGRG